MSYFSFFALQIKAVDYNRFMNEKTIVKQKWISDAAYFKSLERQVTMEMKGSERNDWLEAEQEYQLLDNQRAKLGLVRLN